MFSLIRELCFRVVAKQEAVLFLIAFVLAELFFKFKSFSLECLAFLPVWAMLSFVQSVISPTSKRQRAKS